MSNNAPAYHAAQKLRVGVVGGGIGKEHIKGYQTLPDHFDVVAICDLDAAKAHEVAAAYGIPRVCTSLDDLCAADDIDVIDICTPPHLHFAQIQQALAAHKHTICEKPLVNSLAEVDELLRLEAESGRRMMPIFQYRFGSGLQKLKFLVQEGIAGKALVTSVETFWRRRANYYEVPWRGKWRTELGGALLSHASHAHDMLCYVLGPIKSVFARAATRVNPIEVEDCASVSLEMADGSLASLSVTLGSAVETTRHCFCFSNLRAESNTQPYTNSSDPWAFTGDTPEVAAQIEDALHRFAPVPEGFAGQFYRFHRALQDGTALPVTLLDARASLELITAMYYSAEIGQPVALPIGSDHPMYRSWLPAAERNKVL
jgi:predicted dehydrogenase